MFDIPGEDALVGIQVARVPAYPRIKPGVTMKERRSTGSPRALLPGSAPGHCYHQKKMETGRTAYPATGVPYCRIFSCISGLSCFTSSALYAPDGPGTIVELKSWRVATA